MISQQKTNENTKTKNNEDNWSLSYDSLINAIIRPPRSNNYHPDDLCSPIFVFNGREYSRKDITLINKKNNKLECSFIQPLQSYRVHKTMPVVIYLHGNSSNREEGMNQVPLLLRHHINVFLFDFSGSGLSEGEYITLGYQEKDDLETVVNFLSSYPGVGKIGVWGRSMGAATALMYLYKDSRIKAAVIDSTFADFNVLAKQLCRKVKAIPDILINFAMYFVKKTIKERCGFEIEELRPIDHAKLCTAAAFFIHAMKDELIPLEHTLKIYEQYGGEKVLNVCGGGHHTKRDKELLEKVATFLINHLSN